MWGDVNGAGARPTLRSMDTPPPIEERVSTGAVKVQVLDEYDLPIPGATVCVMGPNMMVAQEAFTDPEGRVRIDGLPPGSIEVVVERDGFEPAHRREVAVEAGRIAMVPVTLRVMDYGEPLFHDLLPALLPDHGRRGASLDDSTLAALPQVSLGGLAGLMSHPALGAGEAVPAQIFDLSVPETALGAVPWALVGGLDRSSVGLRGGDRAELALPNGPLRGGAGDLTLAGAANGALGGAFTLSGPLIKDRLALVGGVEAGFLGEGAGLVARGQKSEAWFSAGLLRSEDVALAGGDVTLVRYRTSLGLSGLGALTEAGPEARAALRASRRVWLGSTHSLSTRLEGLSGVDTTAALISVNDIWDVRCYTVLPSARVRLGVDEAPRLEASLGLASGGFRMAGFALAGQRYEGLEALEGGEVRSREALVGGAARLHYLTLTASALGAARMDATSGDALPGRADLQLALSRDLRTLNGVGAITWRPPIEGFNTDLPELETGVLVAAAIGGLASLDPTFGLGLRAASEQGALTGAAAARLGLGLELDNTRLELALEGSYGAAARDQLWLSVRMSASP